MKFNPKSEEDVSRVVLPNGEYPFRVLAAQEKTSKSGNAMIEMNVEVVNSQGQAVRIKDFIVGTDSMAFKLRHFCYAVGLGETYMNGEIHDHFCVNRKGYCRVYVEELKTQDGRPYEVNKIQDYVPAAAPAMAERAPESDDDFGGFH